MSNLVGKSNKKLSNEQLMEIAKRGSWHVWLYTSLWLVTSLGLIVYEENCPCDMRVAHTGSLLVIVLFMGMLFLYISYLLTRMNALTELLHRPHDLGEIPAATEPTTEEKKTS
jgi:phosphatidylglycerophosphate synthase